MLRVTYLELCDMAPLLTRRANLASAAVSATIIRPTTATRPSHIAASITATGVSTALGSPCKSSEAAFSSRSHAALWSFANTCHLLHARIRQRNTAPSLLHPEPEEAAVSDPAGREPRLESRGKRVHYGAEEG